MPFLSELFVGFSHLMNGMRIIVNQPNDMETTGRKERPGLVIG